MAPALLVVRGGGLDNADFYGPEFFADFVAVVLGALGDEKMEVGEFHNSGAVVPEAIDDLDEKLLELLPRDGANLEVAEALDEELCHVVVDGCLGDI